MKNSSWKYPFGTFSDKMFDSNKDGKLDNIETAFRDAYLDETNRKAESQPNDPKKSKYSAPVNNPESKKTSENNTPAGVQLFVIVLVIAVLVGGFVLAISIEGTAFITAAVIFATLAVAIFLLKFAGLYK